MRSCPKCTRVHEDHFKQCLDCGSSLEPTPWYRTIIKVLINVLLIAVGLGAAGYAATLILKEIRKPADVVINDQDPSGLNGFGIPPLTPSEQALAEAEARRRQEKSAKPQITPTPKPTPKPAAYAEASDIVFHPQDETSKTAAQAPSQRKRLVRTNSGSSVTMEDVLAKEDVIHNPVGYYSHAVTEEIMRWYNSLTRKDFDPPQIGSKCRIKLRVDTQTDRFEILEVDGTFNDRGRAMLAAAVERASGRVAVPKAIKDLGVRYELIEFEMAVKPNPSN